MNRMWYMRVTGILVALLGCAEADGVADAPTTTQCELSAAAPEELRAAVEGAAGRLRAATGCELRVAEDGIPLIVAHGGLSGDDTMDACGVASIRTVKKAAGSTVLDSIGIEVDWTTPGCPTAETTIIHEAMHVLANPHGALYVGGHAADGVFAAHRTSTHPKLTEASVEFFCERAECTAFVPEL